VGDALGWFGFGPSPQVSPGHRHTLLSYPGDKPSGTLWQAQCTLAPLGQTAPPLMSHRCPTFAGASGGPLFPPSGAPRIAAVNVAETPDHNLGVQIGPAYAAWLAEVWR
jgi:V8-like Glu-specific endopeptidase